jgi:ComF family protein
MKISDITLFCRNYFTPPVCQIDTCHKKVWKESCICFSCLKKVIHGRLRAAKIEADTNSYSLFSYTKEVQELIHGLKYKHLKKNASFLLRWLPKDCLLMNALKDIDLVTCVPLHKIKKRERGYNQAELLGKTVATTLDVPLKGDLLQRQKHTKTQAKLSMADRQYNMSKIFATNSKSAVLGKRILLVDDVQTTGATTRACRNVLLEAGAIEVKTFTVARA